MGHKFRMNSTPVPKLKCGKAIALLVDAISNHRGSRHEVDHLAFLFRLDQSRFGRAEAGMLPSQMTSFVVISQSQGSHLRLR